jgi:hypothetical protein
VLALLMSEAPSADVRTDQRVKFQLGGVLGKVVNMFGGRAAREGVTSVVAVKGDRKVTLSDATGQIVDLAEEKVYELDMKKKTYKVTTFAEMRAQLEKARREAEQQAAQIREQEQKAEPSKPAEKDPNAKEYEVDLDIKNTGAARTINGFDTKQTVMTITVREKGKTLNEAGGLVVTNDVWLTPSAPSTDEIVEFDMKFAQKVYGRTTLAAGASAQDMTTALAMYPQIRPALEKAAAEGTKMEGTAILTEMKIEAVPPGAADAPAAAPAPEQKKSGGFRGMIGGLKKMAEQGNQNNSSNEKPQRAVVMTGSVEMLKLTKDVDAASVALPAGFKETK